MITELITHPLLYIFNPNFVDAMIPSNHKGSHSLTIPRIGNTNNRYIGHIGVGKQTVFNL
jgi:hypothetical protein